MKFIYYQNPLRTKVILDEQEKETFRLKYKIEYLENIIGGVRYYLKQNPNEVIECPNPYMNGKTYWDLAQQGIPSNFYEDEFEEEILRQANNYLEDLEGYHCGDCTCIPCSCSKCYAESILGIDTIKGLGKHEASSIDGYFSPRPAGQIDTRTIDEVLDLLKNYDPSKETYSAWGDRDPSSHFPRWIEESKRAYAWLLNYKEEHGF